MIHGIQQGRTDVGSADQAQTHLKVATQADLAIELPLYKEYEDEMKKMRRCFRVKPMTWP